MNEPVQLSAFEWRQIVDGATDTAIISRLRDILDGIGTGGTPQDGT